RLDRPNLRPRAEGRRGNVGPMRAVVVASPDETVVGARPDQAVGERRGSDVVHNPAARSLGRRVRGGRLVERRRNTELGSRQIGADGDPGLPAIPSPKNTLIAEIERVVTLAPGQRERPFAAVIAWKGERRIDASRLPGFQV